MVAAVDTQRLTELGLMHKPAPLEKKKELGQEAFLELMTTQMQNQDPMKPMENGEFLGQIAQFAQVKGLQDIQDKFTALSNALYSNQAFQASMLVGRDVMVPGDVGVLPKGGAPMQGAVDLPSGADRVRIDVVAPGGAVVRQLDLGAAKAGRIDFAWDGKNGNGEAMKPGIYGLKVHAQVANKEVAAGSLVQANIESVGFGSNGGEMTLNLGGLGSYNFSEVKEIR